MDTTTRTGSPLRQRMIEDMRMRKLEPSKRVTEALWKPNHCMGTIADRARRRTVCT